MNLAYVKVVDRDLNDQAVVLAAKIQEKFEGLGI